MFDLAIGLAVVVLITPLVFSSVSRRVGYAAIALTGVLLAATLLPRSFLTIVPAPEGVPNDISTASLTMMTGPLAYLIALVIILTNRGQFRLPFSLVVFALALTAGMFLLWEGTVPQWSGYFVLLSAVAAWGVGWAVGREVFTNVRLARYLMIVCLVIVVIQLTIVVLQLSNVQLPEWLAGSDRTLEQTTGRASGTVGHPANLSKITFMLTILALPFTTSADRRTRRLAFLVTIACVVVGGFTISRANLVATFILLSLWILTYPGRARVGTRALGGIALAGATAAFAPMVLERFEDDAAGGLRPQLFEAGMRQLNANLWTGTGPNAYIAVVGQVDSATATGLPIHNTPLLLIAELGLPIAMCFMLPVAGLVWWALRTFPSARRHLYVPRAVTYALPGLGIIFWTGWGMASSLLIGLVMFVFGLLSSARIGISDSMLLPDAALQANPAPLGTDRLARTTPT
ncbi:O-antigen ligase family protein [Microbacterium sp.]|uniref:O-antigen ligase family protein n=1 Tax=Microbacterium sp. TaxID=51671 RepID=UPI0039E2EB1D